MKLSLSLSLSQIQYHPNPGYITKLKHINSKMRSILVDWLVGVHNKFEMQSDTLFLIISVLDRFLAVSRFLHLRGGIVLSDSTLPSPPFSQDLTRDAAD